MKHQYYAKRELSLLERIKRFFSGPRFIAVDPEFTKKHPCTNVGQVFGLRRTMDDPRGGI